MVRLFLLLLFLAFPLVAPGQSNPDLISAPALRQEILAMMQQDQAVQERIMHKAQAGEKIEPSDGARQDSVFRAHILCAKEILHGQGRDVQP